MTKPRPTVFYGWWVVATASLGLFLSTGSIVVLSFGVFLKSLSHDFHAGRTAVSLAFAFHNVIAFYAVLGVVGGTTSPVPYGVVVCRWFDQRRGLALGLMAIGLGLGGILMPLFAQRLTALLGWRTAYASLGGPLCCSLCRL